MKRSFYQFALSFRGGQASDPFAHFAEEMFRDTSFPKQETSFDALSRYVEEKADARMPISIFDELFTIYNEQFRS